jgi:hypothetical protein
MCSATACSVAKTIELAPLSTTKDPTWDGVNLTIWSANELSVGVLIASLPPLRKQFDMIFRKLLPTTLRGTRSKQPNSIPLYNVSKQFTIGTRPSGKTGDDTSKLYEDDSSEKGILPDSDNNGIMKTVVHEVVHEERAGSSDNPQKPVRAHSGAFGHTY